MSSYTNIVSNELVPVNSAEISFSNNFGLCYYTFKTDLWDMLDILSACKEVDGILPITFATLAPIREIIEQFETPNYLIEYENDFADMPDDSCFILPVLNGKIDSKYIIEDTYSNTNLVEGVYKKVGLISPREYLKMEKTKNPLA